MAVCAPTPHSFHPKVWLMVGPEELALLIGSGNLTQSGFMTNVELFDAVRLPKDGPHKSVAQDIIQFLDGLVGLWGGGSQLLAVETLEDIKAAVQGLAAAMPDGDSGDVRFLSNFGVPLWDQFQAYFGGGTLYVAAPFFGGSASAVRTLQEKINPDKIKVFPAVHPGDALDVPLAELGEVPGTSAGKLALAATRAGFAHLKLYGSEVATWGEYNPVGDQAEESEGHPAKEWKRTPRRGQIDIPIKSDARYNEYPLPGIDEVLVAARVRTVKDVAQFHGHIPKGTRAMSVFLVNKRRPAPDSKKDAGFIFQAALELRSDQSFVSRPNLRGLNSDDWDERVADLHYRDVCEYAVGHSVSTRADLCDGECKTVCTAWMPTGEVERVAPADIPGVVLGMEILAGLADSAEAKAQLGPLVAGYRAWIEGQKARVPATHERRKKTGDDLLARARIAADRIAAGIDLLAVRQLHRAGPLEEHRGWPVGRVHPRGKNDRG
jgi:hypothetical protein